MPASGDKRHNHKGGEERERTYTARKAPTSHDRGGKTANHRNTLGKEALCSRSCGSKRGHSEPNRLQNQSTNKKEAKSEVSMPTPRGDA